MLNLNTYLASCLGFPAVDVLTKFTGIITEVTFDINAKITVTISDAICPNGELPVSVRFDSARVELI